MRSREEVERARRHFREVFDATMAVAAPDEQLAIGAIVDVLTWVLRQESFIGPSFSKLMR